ncbi:uncharacterized protein LOC129738153 [Uranotaenia lowii]|uniref:uncharacterized protein LOC129738153 n=1 Tax=Uranotaenia lowii TaxID=190385 RepID=UPI002478EB74|nr:uncharacterized protein LOC129738153 [Uranotaenia lowii]
MHQLNMSLASVLAVAFGVFVLYRVFGNGPAVVVSFNRIEQLFGADVANFSQLKLVQSCCGAPPTLDGSWQLKQDLDNSWILVTQMFYRPPDYGYEAFPIPINFRSVPVCDYLNSCDYGQFWFRYRYNTNFPERVLGRWMCPLPRGEYQMRMAPLGTGFLPWFPKVGAYRFEFRLMRGGVLRMSVALFFDVAIVQ